MIAKIKSSRKWQLSILGIFIVIAIAAFWYFRANPVMPQMTIYFLSEVNLPQQGDTVLIFAPHPDDETIACGGYINESVKRGAEVHIVLVTDGNRRNLQVLRYLEFENATRTLGVPGENLVYLNYPDSRLALENCEKLKEVLAEQIEKVQPDILLYPHPNDTHKDHSTVGTIIEEIMQQMKEKVGVKEYLLGYEDLVKEEVWEELEVVEKIAKKITCYKYLVHHAYFPYPKKYAPELFVLPPLDLVTIEGGWEKFMLSEETKKTKERALRAYVSQLRNPLLKNLLEASIRENEIFAVN
ncbi:MAG TPA: PIG-L family deacetylase [Atribacterota bacterium]|nr:PIG-L family deacetylase [Atribacterota bacterium]